MAKITNEKVHILYLGSVFVTGEIECLTGLHIGGADDSLQIGGINKYVIKNPRDNKPYIPGSSLKGKMRSMLEKSCGKIAKRKASDGIYRYEADTADEAINCEVSRLFGSTGTEGTALNFPARLTVRDLEVQAGYKLEKKSENTLDRLSAHANPRTNERVAKGSKFNLELKYDVEVILNEQKVILLGNATEPHTIHKYWQMVANDLNNILDSFLLIEASALGGNGSRGYGKVQFNEVKFDAKTVAEIREQGPPAELELSEAITINIDTVKFKTEREKISAILKKFNGMYNQIYNEIQVDEVIPDTPEVTP